MSAYPNAYCVKCGSHTDTLQKHTVVLQNNARALRGVCASCDAEVYKILPKLKDAPKQRLTEEERRKYPDAFCVKCQTHTPTVNAHTVILDNMSRAVTGCCKNCNSEVYRIIGGKAEAPARAEAAATKVRSDKIASHPVGTAPRTSKALLSSRAVAAKAPAVPLTRRAEEAPGSGRLSLFLATGVIVSIVAAFVLLAAG